MNRSTPDLHSNDRIEDSYSRLEWPQKRILIREDAKLARVCSQTNTSLNMLFRRLEPRIALRLSRTRELSDCTQLLGKITYLHIDMVEQSIIGVVVHGVGDTSRAQVGRTLVWGQGEGAETALAGSRLCLILGTTPNRSCARVAFPRSVSEACTRPFSPRARSRSLRLGPIIQVNTPISWSTGRMHVARPDGRQLGTSSVCNPCFVGHV